MKRFLVVAVVLVQSVTIITLIILSRRSTEMCIQSLTHAMSILDDVRRVLEALAR